MSMIVTEYQAEILKNELGLGLTQRPQVMNDQHLILVWISGLTAIQATSLLISGSVSQGKYLLGKILAVSANSINFQMVA